jgi:hypothetical protein
MHEIKIGRMPSRDREMIIAAFCMALVAVGTLLLFARHPFPPLFDWPNHMARHHLAARVLVGESLPVGYAIQYGPMPNLGADLVMPGLIALLGDTVASQVFLGSSALFLWGSASALYIQYAGITRSSVAAIIVLAPWLISATMFLGFMNYFSGCGVGIFAAVHFISMARSRARIWTLILHAMFAILTYLWHLAAFGIYGVLAASYLLHRMLEASPAERSRVLSASLPLVATMMPAVLLALWVASTPTTNALRGALVWRGVVEKAKNVAEVFMAYSNAVDAILLSLWLVCLLLIFTISPIRRLRLDYMSIAAMAFLGLIFALPSDIGVTYFVDKRPALPFFICCCGLLSSLPTSRLFRAGMVGILALTVVRIAYIDESWAARSKGTLALLRYFSAVEKGARILVANTNYGWRRAYETQVSGWLVASTDAYVSNLWAIPGQQPLRHTMPSYGLVPTHFLSDPRVLCTYATTISAHFDYVWVNDPTAIVHVPSGWEMRLKTKESLLLKVMPNAGSCSAPSDYAPKSATLRYQ